jgi:hypothetical protein
VSRYVGSDTTKDVVPSPANQSGDGYFLAGVATHANAGAGATYNILIPGDTYPMIRYTAWAVGSGAAQLVMLMQFNADSGANYGTIQVSGNGTTVSTVVSAVLTNIGLCATFAASGTVKTSLASGNGYIASGQQRKVSVLRDYASTVAPQETFHVGTWTNTANAVASVNITFPTGMIGNFYLYARGL